MQKRCPEPEVMSPAGCWLSRIQMCFKTAKVSKVLSSRAIRANNSFQVHSAQVDSLSTSQIWAKNYLLPSQQGKKMKLNSSKPGKCNEKQIGFYKQKKGRNLSPLLGHPKLDSTPSYSKADSYPGIPTGMRTGRT